MADEKHVFTASRWTAGNFLFPVRLEITPERVTRIKPRLLGSDEETISLAKVASVSIQTGMLWSDIRIDSTGGTNPILSHGHTKEDAHAIRDLIQRFQQRPPAGSAD
jgi:hypothetical protein